MWTSVASVRPFDQAAAEQRPTRPVPSQTNRAIALPHWAGASLCIDYSRLLDIARRLHDEPRTWVGITVHMSPRRQCAWDAPLSSNEDSGRIE